VPEHFQPSPSVSLPFARPDRRARTVFDSDVHYRLVVKGIHTRCVFGNRFEDVIHYTIRRLGRAAEDDFFYALASE
jgi:hypothetical protein